MSGQTPSKDEADVSPKSSWEIISESENSRSNSIENISLQECEEIAEEKPIDEQKIESAYIDIPEEQPGKSEDNACININMPDNTDFNKRTKKKTSKSNIKKPYNKLTNNKRVTDAFTALSIAASIIALSGITLLCCLLPNQEDQKPLEKIQVDYLELIKGNSKNLHETINNTAELIQKINNDNYKSNNPEIFQRQCLPDDEVCIANSSESFLNFNSQEFFKNEPTDRLNNDALIYDTYTFDDIKTTTSSLVSSLKDVCTNPSLHIFLCTLMQDVCLIRLVNQLEKKQSMYEKLNQPTLTKDQKKTKPSEKIVKKQPRKKSQSEKPKTQIKAVSAETVKPLSVKTNFNVTPSAPQLKSNVTLETPLKAGNGTSKFMKSTNNKTTVESLQKSINENGKSECERRFEELDNKWKIAGKNHLLKMQEIKEKYRTELNQIRDNEKEIKRRQKIKLLRESYIQKLKSDREKYLMQLRKIKDEREKTLNQICQMKKKSEYNSKDLSIGNFVLSQNNNREKLFNLQLNKESDMQVKRKISPLNVPYDEYANFWKNLINQQTKKEDSKPNLKKKGLRKPKTNSNIQETVAPRGIDKKTENALIEEIVKKVMYNLADLRIKNESNILSKPKRSKTLRKPKPRTQADQVENETLVSKYAPTKSNPVPTEISNVTAKIDSRGTESNQNSKSYISLKSTDSQSTYSLAPLLYPNNSSFEIIDAESLTGPSLSKTPSSNIFYEDFVADNNGNVHFGPLAENYSFTTIAKRKPIKKETRKNYKPVMINKVIPFSNSENKSLFNQSEINKVIPPLEPYNKTVFNYSKIDRIIIPPLDSHNKTSLGHSDIDRVVIPPLESSHNKNSFNKPKRMDEVVIPPLESHNKTSLDDFEMEGIAMPPLESWNKNSFNKSKRMDKVTPFTWSGNESYSFIPITPNDSFKFPDKQEEGENLPLLDDSEFPALKYKPKENFFSNVTIKRPLSLITKKNKTATIDKNRIHSSTLEIVPTTSGQVTSFHSTYTVTSNQETKLKKINVKEQYEDSSKLIPRVKEVEGDIQKKEEILEKHLEIKSNKTANTDKNIIVSSSIEMVPNISGEDTSNNSTNVNVEEIIQKMLQSKPKNKDDINANIQRNNELQLVVRSTPPKQDIYNIVFDEAGEKIKKEQTSQKHLLPKNSPIVPLLSKQPPKLPKKVYLFKGRL